MLLAAALTSPPAARTTRRCGLWPTAWTAGNGVYKYGASGFPNQTFNASNYWVDVVFETSVGPDTTSPTVRSVSPTDGATGVSTSANVTATFNEAMDAATIDENTIELRDAADNVVPASISYNAASRTAVLDPDDPWRTPKRIPQP